MSKASEWAQKDHERVLRLEAAQQEIERELGLDTTAQSHRLARVEHFEGIPRLRFNSFNFFAPPGFPVLDTAEACEFARWILDTFGEADHAH